MKRPLKRLISQPRHFRNNRALKPFPGFFHPSRTGACFNHAPVFAAVEGCRQFDKELIEPAHLVKKGAQDGFEEPAAREQAALLPLLTTFEARASAFLSEEAKQLLSRVVEKQTAGATAPTVHVAVSSAAD